MTSLITHSLANGSDAAGFEDLLVPLVVVGRVAVVLRRLGPPAGNRCGGGRGRGGRLGRLTAAFTPARRRTVRVVSFGVAGGGATSALPSIRGPRDSGSLRCGGAAGSACCRGLWASAAACAVAATVGCGTAAAGACTAAGAGAAAAAGQARRRRAVFAVSVGGVADVPTASRTRGPTPSSTTSAPSTSDDRLRSAAIGRGGRFVSVRTVPGHGRDAHGTGVAARRPIRCARRQLCSSAAITLSRPSRNSLPIDFTHAATSLDAAAGHRLEQRALHLGRRRPPLSPDRPQTLRETIGSSFSMSVISASSIAPHSASPPSASIIDGSLPAHHGRDELGLALRRAVQPVADDQLPQHDRERIDVALRLALPSSCSGAEYASLPLNVPSRVTCAAIVAFATPKSSRRADPSVETITFCGDTSRWTMPSGVPISSVVSCAACRPASTWRRDRHRDAHGDVLLVLARGAEEHVQRHAVHVLLHEHDVVGRRDEVEHRYDVPVMDLRRDPRLVHEHRDELGVLGELGQQALRRDDAREPLVADEARDMDRRHTAARDLAMQDVPADGHLI